MPTAAKLVAAFAFAALSLLIATLYIPQLPKGTQLGYFRQITAAIGLLCGWWIMGNMVGRGYRAAAESGLRTSVTIVFWALLGFSIYIMIDRSMRMMYDGPMEAVLGVFQLMIEYGKKMLVPDVMIAVLFGGILAGQLTEWVGKRAR
jgi:hypothetical protein